MVVAASFTGSSTAAAAGFACLSIASRRICIRWVCSACALRVAASSSARFLFTASIFARRSASCSTVGGGDEEGRGASCDRAEAGTANNITTKTNVNVHTVGKRPPSRIIRSRSSTTRPYSFFVPQNHAGRAGHFADRGMENASRDLEGSDLASQGSLGRNLVDTAVHSERSRSAARRIKTAPGPGSTRRKIAGIGTCRNLASVHGLGWGFLLNPR